MNNKNTNKDQPKSDFLKKFEMSEADDLQEEEDVDHVHVEGCCSCHSNVGK